MKPRTKRAHLAARVGHAVLVELKRALQELIGEQLQARLLARDAAEHEQHAQRLLVIGCVKSVGV